MKGRIVIAAATMMLVFAPTSHADDVGGYLDMLHERGITASSGDGTLVYIGQLICNTIENGSTPMQAAMWVYSETPASIDAEDSGYIVGAAIVKLCPEYLSLIKEYA